MPIAQELARLVGGELIGDSSVEVTGVASLEGAGPGDVSFAQDGKNRKIAATSSASVIVTDASIEGCEAAQIVVQDPNLAIALIGENLTRAAAPEEPGVHPGAVVDPEADVDAAATIHAQVTVGPRARVGARTVLHPGVRIGAGASVGEDCVLHPNVCLLHDVTVGSRVILHAGVIVGSDGFGYATTQEGNHVKIPQVGTVVIEDDVEIGANTTVDRARFSETRIERGAKIDNLVMVAHNVIVGAHSLLVAQVGIAGSTRLGHHVVLGGHVGVKGHLNLGPGAQVGAYSGVGSDLEPGQGYAGIPATPIKQALKIRAVQGRLPDLQKRLRALEQKVADLEGRDA
jgi:UDP-3-O-[3-hydroxymyristoyl] glucosamine N-acyltransferase